MHKFKSGPAQKNRSNRMSCDWFNCLSLDFVHLQRLCVDTCVREVPSVQKHQNKMLVAGDLSAPMCITHHE